MSGSVWLMEYRTRERKNGKWSEWYEMDYSSNPRAAYRSFPNDRMVSEVKYERRAVEYVRATIASTATPAQTSAPHPSADNS